MKESTIIIDDGAIARGQVESVLETTLREGARRLLQEALELEVEEYARRIAAGGATPLQVTGKVKQIVRAMAGCGGLPCAAKLRHILRQRTREGVLDAVRQAAQPAHTGSSGQHPAPQQ